MVTKAVIRRVSSNPNTTEDPPRRAERLMHVKSLETQFSRIEEVRRDCTSSGVVLVICSQLPDLSPVALECNVSE
ncbi:hypothetical protein TNCV_3391171 [Trichonephila clavipes]|nr:hypothetical protein TNCV_3391171 [Trichonephila clavipes]